MVPSRSSNITMGSRSTALSLGAQREPKQYTQPWEAKFKWSIEWQKKTTRQQQGKERKDKIEISSAISIMRTMNEWVNESRNTSRQLLTMFTPRRWKRKIHFSFIHSPLPHLTCVFKTFPVVMAGNDFKFELMISQQVFSLGFQHFFRFFSL